MKIDDSASDGIYTVAVNNEGDCWSDRSDGFDYVNIEGDGNRNIQMQITPTPAYNKIFINLDETN
jgi:hypothetical protein